VSSVRLYHGDALDILTDLEPLSVDAIITDPPYCSGARTNAEVVNRNGMSRKPKWAAKPLDTDRMTSVGFVWLMREVAIEAERLLPEGGSFLCFIDWRQYPHLYGAIESANLRIQNLVVWDKKNMSMGNGFRNQHELIIHATKGVPTVYNRSIPNVISHTRISSSEAHPTEKPVGLMDLLLSVVTKRGQTVLDPFAGSGTTGVACVRSGRNFIGAEKDETYYCLAQSKIAAAQSQGDLFARHSGEHKAEPAVEQSDLFASLP